MSIDYLIKIAIGLVVVVTVIWGLSKFGGNIIDFLKDLGGEPAKAIFGILK